MLLILLILIRTLFMILEAGLWWAARDFGSTKGQTSVTSAALRVFELATLRFHQQKMLDYTSEDKNAGIHANKT